MEKRDFGILQKHWQVLLIQQYCNEMELEYLYPFTQLGDLLDDWEVTREEVWELAERNKDVNSEAKIFTGESFWGNVTSFNSWSNYLEYFWENVDNKEFWEWFQAEHSDFMEAVKRRRA